jgi:3-oxoacyl-[acyl-carrier-protein] synthase II
VSLGVVVTGLGTVAPHGEEPQALFDALLAGRSAVREFAAELDRPAAVAAVMTFDESRWFTKLQLPGVDRVSQLAVAAAELAVRDAGGLDGADRERVGVYVGCGMGGATALETAYRMGMATPRRVPPLTVPAFMPNAAASHIAMRQRVLGPVITYSVACASSAVAIAEAAKAVDRGEIDVAIAGGAEALLVPGVVSAWQAMHTLATFTPGDAESAGRACRPFALDRSGFVLGEGAAFLVLEPPARARARGRSGYARLAGWGISCDATHLTKPDVAGQQRALRAALSMADMTPGEVGYCNAHGTATRIGDPVEAAALCGLWGEAIGTLRVSSTKALHGHLLGAAGALEALITVLAVSRRQLPPNANVTQPDDSMGLALVQDTDNDAPLLQAAISNSFAFGGTNSALLFARA